MLARVPLRGELRVWPPPWAVIALLLGGVGGVALVAAGPLVLFAALAGAAVAVAMLRSPQTALLVFVGIVSLLPFGVIPLRIGVQLTLLDATLTMALVVTLLGLLRERRPLVSSPLNAPLVLFIGLATVSFVVGTSF